MTVTKQLQRTPFFRDGKVSVVLGSHGLCSIYTDSALSSPIPSHLTVSAPAPPYPTTACVYSSLLHSALF